MAGNEMREPRGSINRALSVGSLQNGSFDNSVFVDCVIDEADDQVRSPSAGHVTTNSSHTNGNSSQNNCVMASLNTSVCRDLQAKTTKESQKFHADPYANADKWPTGYFHQLLTLTHRNFKQNRYLVLSKLDISKHIMMACVTGALWFQVTFAEENIRDISGLMFFMSAYWGFESIYSSLTSFQLERAVLAKERAAGAYRLSVYFMSKVIGVLPLFSTLTIVSVTITFWMAGLHKSVLVFFCYVATLLLNVQAGQVWMRLHELDDLSCLLVGQDNVGKGQLAGSGLRGGEREEMECGVTWSYGNTPKSASGDCAENQFIVTPEVKVFGQ
eukprot:XP_011678999.1 PREDICTED: ABC transporter G family member 9 [Strongylocentrotus purpuratus]